MSKGKKSRISLSSKAGIVFPVGRIGRYMRTKGTYRVAADAPVYMAAVLEFLCAELLEVAGEECLYKKLKIIKPKHFETSIRIDPELERLFQNRTFINGGTAPINQGK